MAQMQRNTAYKVWIGDLFKGNISADESRFNYIEISNKKIVRVNLIANVVDKYESSTKPYASLTLDDSSGQIRVKAFEDIENIKQFGIGNTILVVGTLRCFNDELYLLPEIVKHVDEKWLLVRKLELGEQLKQASENSISAKESQITPETAEQKEMHDSNSEKIEVETMKIESEKIEPKEIDMKSALYDKIKQKEDGLDIDDLIMSVSYPVSEINTTITELIEEGKIYEPQPGKLRSI